jgi:DNA-directed RNA polymerase subunit RPC12/RpoP
MEKRRVRDGEEDEDKKVVELRLATSSPDAPRVYERTIVDNSRRYAPERCDHKGPYIVDRKLGSVECEDCGARLNPIFVLEMLASQEAYWNLRQRDLAKYLAEINAEIAERTRTRCTHCGNMTAIRFKKEMPKTWVPRPY